MRRILTTVLPLCLSLLLCACIVAPQEEETETIEPYDPAAEPEKFEGERLPLPDYEKEGGWVRVSMAEQVLPGNPDWIVFGSLRYEEGFAVSRADAPEFEVIRNYCLGSGENYLFDFDLFTDVAYRGDLSKTDDGFYVGLHLPAMTSVPATADGVWLKFYRNKIAVQGDSLGDFTVFSLPYGVGGVFRRVFIEDLQETGIINIYVSDNEDTRVLALTLRFFLDEADRTVLRASSFADGFSSETNIRKGIHLYGGGYTKLYNNGNAEVKLRDIAFRAM